MREPGSIKLVVGKLRLRSLCQLRKELTRYVRVDVLPETVAIGNVSANKQPVKPVVWRVEYNRNTRNSGVRLSSYYRCVVGKRGNSTSWVDAV